MRRYRQLAAAGFLLFAMPGIRAQDLVLWASSTVPVLSSENLATSDCSVGNGCAPSGPRRLLRFSVEVRNLGPADLNLGNPAASTNFLNNACTGEFEYREWYEFRLVNGGGSTVLVRRVNRCVSDTMIFQPIGFPIPQFNCGNQGLQHDWLCLHTNTLPCQFLDVTGLASGSYTLHVEVNPARHFAETSYANNSLQIPVALTPCHTLTLLARAFSDAVGGNGNGALDPGETIREFAILTNTGCSVTGAVGTIYSTTPGVTVVQPSSPYPAMTDGGVATNTVGFAYRLAKSIACGSTITLRQEVATAEGIFSNTWTRNVGRLETLAVLTNTYAWSGSVTIPTYGQVVATNVVSVAGLAFIDDVDVLVRLDHVSDLDIDVLLIPPWGGDILLGRTDDVGPNYGSGNNCNSATFTVFDDEAAQSFSAGTAPFSGSYRPIEPLSVLDGHPPSGTWRLRVDDVIPDDGGTLRCWRLRIVYHTAQYVCTPFSSAPIASNIQFVVGHLATNLQLVGDDADGDPLVYRTNSPPTRGVLSGLQTNTGLITYTPSPDYVGADSFTFRVTDGASTSAPALVSLVVGDRDADGLPDAWEARFFGNPDATGSAADSDSDGLLNWEEFIADSVPTNAASRAPRVVQIQRAAGPQLTLDWSSTGRLYEVLSSTDLLQGAWSMAAPAVPGTGTGLVLTATNTDGRAFQRIGITKP